MRCVSLSCLAVMAIGVGGVLTTVATGDHALTVPFGIPEMAGLAGFVLSLPSLFASEAVLRGAVRRERQGLSACD